MRISRRRKLLYSILGIFLLLLLTEGLAQIVLRTVYNGAHRRVEDMATEYDPQLGWRLRRNYYYPNRYGEGKHVTYNSQGFRARKDYTSEVPSGRYRIICLGDSFTYGSVGDDETYPARFEAHCPSIETVNMGMGGYGVDQSYLWYERDGSKFQTNLLLCAFIEDDFERMTQDTFRTRSPKPQLRIVSGKPTWVNIPVPTWGQVSATGWFEEFPRRTAFYQLTRKVISKIGSSYDLDGAVAYLLDSLKRNSKSRNQDLALVYLPCKKDVGSHQAAPIAGQLEAMSAKKDIHFVNLTKAFKALPAEEISGYFLPDGHYSAKGNDLVSTTLLGEFRNKIAEFPR